MTMYLLSVIQPAGGTPPPAEKLAEIGRNVEQFHQELKASGAWVFAGGLDAPSSASVLRMQGGAQVVTDGPFAEGKEYLGGVCIVEADNREAALDWARKCARATTLPIEVRPFHWVSNE